MRRKSGSQNRTRRLLRKKNQTRNKRGSTEVEDTDTNEVKRNSGTIADITAGRRVAITVAVTDIIAVVTGIIARVTVIITDTIKIDIGTTEAREITNQRQGVVLR